jgi:hypothetical protein
VTFRTGCEASTYYYLPHLRTRPWSPLPWWRAWRAGLRAARGWLLFYDTTYPHLGLWHHHHPECLTLGCPRASELAFIEGLLPEREPNRQAMTHDQARLRNLPTTTYHT